MRRARERAGLLTTIAVAALSTVAATLGLPSTSGALIGSVQNSSNTAASAVVSTNAATCAAAATALSDSFVYPFDEVTGSTTAGDVSGNNRPGTYQLPASTVYGAAGPCPRDSGRAITLNGSSSYVSGPTASVAGTNVFSEAIWFRTTTTRGGKLIGFGNARTGSSTSYDRHLYMTNSGTVTFGVYPNTVKTVASPLAYNDGAWHLAAATLGTNGMRLYLDGAQVGVDTTVTTAQAYTGFWRIGYDNLNAWTNTPTSSFFAGSLAYASVYTTTLTATQIQGLYDAGR